MRSVLMLSAIVTAMQAGPAPAEDGAALDIFNRRILPILKSPRPSSCAECHLSGVDLKDYIRADQAQTFAALRDGGLIDTRNADESRLLKFIARGPERPTIVSQNVRDEEYAAFRAWIRAAVSEPQLLQAKSDGEPLGPAVPDEVVRHARRDRVLASFVDNVWSEAARCAACHAEGQNQKQVEKHGAHVSWIKPRDPAASLAHLLEHGQIDVDDPAQSLLLTKPTNQVEHGGGIKLVTGDRTYNQFRRFIEDYAAVSKGRYKAADELPAAGAEVSLATDIWLKITDVPEPYVGKLLRADVHRWTDAGWSATPVAVGDRLVYPKHNVWQQHLSLVAPRGTRRAEEIRAERASLPAGKYLVRVHVDEGVRIARDPEGRAVPEAPARPGTEQFVGTVEVQSRWPKGYGQMTVVEFPAP
jgi:mono/diheme cytochrome c family protein